MAEPMYRKIAQDLREKIESGAIAPGEQLPTELLLRDQYGASRNTIRDAVKLLMSLGLVETRPGQGTFAVKRLEPFVTTLTTDPETGLGGGEGERAFAEVRERGRTLSASMPRVEVRSAPGYIAARLRIPAGTTIITRRQERYIERTPWSVQTTAYPMELVTQGAADLLKAQDIPGGTIRYLNEKLGLRQIGHRDRLLVRPPTEEEARFFRLPDDGRVSVVSLIRTGYQDSPEGPVPFRVTFTVFPADRNQFVINSGAVPKEPASPASDAWYRANDACQVDGYVQRTPALRPPEDHRGSGASEGLACYAQPGHV
jgi:GntR family transcriptional regulator